MNQSHTSRQEDPGNPCSTVFISNTYSWYNKGDAAIILGTIDAIRHGNDQVRIIVSSTTPDIDTIHYGKIDVEVVSGPLHKSYGIGRFKRRLAFVRKIAALMGGAVVAKAFGPLPERVLPEYPGRYLSALRSSTYVISCGGGFWSGNSGISIFGHIAEVWCALMFRKRVGVVGVSIGSFPNPLVKALVGWTLRRTEIIVLREQDSLAHLRSLGVPESKTASGGDLAFCMNPVDSHTHIQTPDLARNTDRIRIGITARWWTFPNSVNPEHARATYERELAQGLDSIIETFGAEITFIPQVIVPETDDDRIIQRRIRDLMTHREHVQLLEDDLAPSQIIALVGEFDFMIATRFHSAIFALLASTPTIAISYEIKTPGIMKLLGLDEWVIRIEDVTANELLIMFGELHANHDAVRNRITRAVAQQRADAMAATEAALLQVSPEATPVFRIAGATG